MEKLGSALIAAVMVVCSLTSCQGNNQETKPADTAAPVTSTEATTTEPEPVKPAAPEIEIADNAIDFAKNMKFGWNLGNTLDATSSMDLSSETSWGQPKTTKELINYLKEVGFTSIRIPVSWGNHTDADYNIDPEWMARVTEVVDYAMESGLYIILNSHHDCDYYYPSDEKLEKSKVYLKKIWEQIAENFENYDERLVFESMNEPRLKDTSKEWWFMPDDEEGVASIKCIVQLNQLFVDTIRSAGGYNKTRFLMVPSHAASPDNALNDAFEMPTDTAKNRLILSAHAYTPYDFAMNKKGYKVWNGKKIGDLDFMKRLKEKFIDNGYGVVIGEFGATNKDNNDDRVAWAKDYCGLAAEIGISCFLWDNGGTRVGEENFGMIDRRELKIYFPDVFDAMLGCFK